MVLFLNWFDVYPTLIFSMKIKMVKNLNADNVTCKKPS